MSGVKWPGCNILSTTRPQISHAADQPRLPFSRASGLCSQNQSPPCLLTYYSCLYIFTFKIFASSPLMPLFWRERILALSQLLADLNCIVVRAPVALTDRGGERRRQVKERTDCAPLSSQFFYSLHKGKFIFHLSWKH